MKVVQSLSSQEQNMLWHCERKPALTVALVTVFLLFQFTVLTTVIAIFLFIVCFGLLRIAGKIDPQMIDIYLRHNKQSRVYSGPEKVVTPKATETLSPLPEMRPISKLLPWLLHVDDGVILLKDGQYLAGWKYIAPDRDALSDIENHHIDKALNRIISSLDGNLSLSVQCIRQVSGHYPEASECAFDNAPASRYIDDLRREKARQLMYTNEYYLFVTTELPSEIDKKAESFFFTNEAAGKGQSFLSESLSRFQSEVSKIETMLATIIQLQPLKSYRDPVKKHRYCRLLSALNLCLTGIHKEVPLSPIPVYLDQYLANHQLLGGLELEFNNEYVNAISIQNLPSDTSRMVFRVLESLPFQFRWSTRYISLDREKAEEIINKQRKLWSQKTISLLDQITRKSNPKVDQHAVKMVQEIDAGVSMLTSGEISFGVYTSVILLRNEDKQLLQAMTDLVYQSFLNEGPSIQTETINALEAFLSSLPGNITSNVRMPIFSSMNVAEVFPISSVYTGSETNPCKYYPSQSPAHIMAITEGLTPFYFNCHVEDLGHTFIGGPTGSGKSVILNLIVSQARKYKNAKVFHFDKDYSALPLCAGDNGRHYNLLADTGYQFAPFASLNGQMNKDVSWACELIEIILELHKQVITPEQRAAILDAIKTTLEAEPNCEYRSFESFMINLQSNALKQILSYYGPEGQVGGLFNGFEDSSNLEGGCFNVFEMSSLLETGEKIYIPALTILFKAIDQALDGEPVFIVIDEAWMFFKNRRFMEKVVEWLKVLRKKNAVMIMATQDIEDADNRMLLKSINDACLTKILLPNASAISDEFNFIYSIFGLSQSQRLQISKAQRKRDYYCYSPQGGRMVNFNIDKRQLAYLAAPEADEVEEIINHIGQPDYHSWWEAKKGLVL